MLAQPLSAVAADVAVSAVVPAVVEHSRAETQLLVVTRESGPEENINFV